jgi:hypothetical protein
MQRGGRGLALALAGRRAEARDVLDELHAEAARRYVSPYCRSLVHIAMGEVDLGYDWLSKAVEARCRHIAYIDCHSACNIDPLSRGIGVQN